VKRVLILLCLLLLPLTGRAEGDEKSWRFVGFTRYRDAMYVDMTRVTEGKDRTLTVWTRVKPAPKSILRNRLQGEFKKARRSVKELASVEQQKELDCRRERIRHLRTVYRDREGRVLIDRKSPASLWQLVGPAGLWRSLSDNVCPAAAGKAGPT